MISALPSVQARPEVGQAAWGAHPNKVRSFQESEKKFGHIVPHTLFRRPVIISALWQYIKTHKLQDQHEKEFVNCDPFLKQIFQVE